MAGEIIINFHNNTFNMPFGPPGQWVTLGIAWGDGEGQAYPQGVTLGPVEDGQLAIPQDAPGLPPIGTPFWMTSFNARSGDQYPIPADGATLRLWYMWTGYAIIPTPSNVLTHVSATPPPAPDRNPR